MPSHPSARQNMGIEEILEVLPHRPPFLLIDRILDISPGAAAVGLKAVTMNEPFFAGHFPGHPVMPAVLITEAMAQVGGVLLLTVSGNEGKIAYFAGIDRQKFRRPVGPGDLLVTRVEMIAAKGHIGKVKAEAYVFRLESSSLDTGVNGDNSRALPHNSISLVNGSSESEGQREKKMLLGLMEGELAAEGELMFALVSRQQPPGETG